MCFEDNCALQRWPPSDGQGSCLGSFRGDAALIVEMRRKCGERWAAKNRQTAKWLLRLMPYPQVASGVLPIGDLEMIEFLHDSYAKHLCEAVVYIRKIDNA